MLSKKLIEIDTNAPVDVDFEDFAVKQPDREKLTRIFNELGFSRLLAKLGLSESSQKQNSRTKHNVKARRPSGPDSIDTIDHNYRLVDTEEKLKDFTSRLKKQSLFAVDTETNSLDPMRADLVGISFAWEPFSAYYLAVKAPLGQNQLDMKSLRSTLVPILADAGIKKVGQNLKYDMLVLLNAKMPLEGPLFDTMVASYCLDPQRSHSMDKMAADFLNYHCVAISQLIGKAKNQITFDRVDTSSACLYAAEDADITLQLYHYLKPRLDRQPPLKELFEKVEMPLVNVLTNMEYNGVTLDTSLLRKMSVQLSRDTENLREQIHHQAGKVFNIDSPKQLGEILFDKLSLQSFRTGKAGRSTGAVVLERLTGQHPVIEMILRYRQLNKLQNTYVDKLGTLINPRTGKVHASFNQTITATGRLSSSRPNLQNIPVRTEIGRKIRSAFIPAAKSDHILSADYSQIELRMLAHFSKDYQLTKAFAEDRDIHKFVASQIYGVPVQEVTSQMRSSCKAVNFGIIYGQGPYGLAQTTGMTTEKAKLFIDNYFSRYHCIREFMDRVIEKAGKTGFVETIMHRRRSIPNLKSKNTSKRNQAERLAVNTVIQGSAADLIKLAMINIQKKIKNHNLPVKLILQIHDELVFELPIDEITLHARWIDEEMTNALKLDVPLKVDIKHGPTWLTEK